MPGAAHSFPHPVPHGDFPMLTRLLAAIDRFEDRPAGRFLGLVVLFALPLALLALNEGGVR